MLNTAPKETGTPTIDQAGTVDISTKKAFLIYPPGRIFQRGEDRCQINVEASSVQSVRPPNDLGYAAAMLRGKGMQVFLKDYQTSHKSMEELLEDFNREEPDIIFLSTTYSTLYEDLEVAKQLRKLRPDLLIIFKSAIFFNPEESLLEDIESEQVNYFIGGESEFIIGDLVEYHYNSPEKIPTLRGLVYQDEEEQWMKTDFETWEEDLEKLRFPDRGLFDKELYLRPDTREPMATVVTSRGCPASCTYCVTPMISGKKLRVRDPEHIFDELYECYHEHGIKNFFFKSDSFTINRKWVQNLCDRIAKSDLQGKIEWVANSRVNPIEQETLFAMKETGCWLVAYGFESGSPRTLKGVRKGATVEDNLRAAEMSKKAKLKVYGTFLMGLPWEEMSDLEMTKEHIWKLDPDFIEIHLAVPFHGTPLYEDAKEAGVLGTGNLGKDFFNAPTLGTKHMEMEEIEKFRKKTLLQFHLRPKYLWRRFAEGVRRPKILGSYFKHGMKLLKNTLK